MREEIIRAPSQHTEKQFGTEPVRKWLDRLLTPFGEIERPAPPSERESSPPSDLIRGNGRQATGDGPEIFFRHIVSPARTFLAGNRSKPTSPPTSLNTSYGNTLFLDRTLPRPRPYRREPKLPSSHGYVRNSPTRALRPRRKFLISKFSLPWRRAGR